VADSARPGKATTGSGETAEDNARAIAKRAGTSRTRVTAMLNDDLDHVSSDLLIRFLASLGYSVKVSVVKADRAA
jgi:predicted XRE-type DNA-binding protein